MQPAEPPANHYDAIRDEINTRKEAVMTARSVPAEHLGQYGAGDVTGLAASKLEGYRRNSGAMRTYNQATGHLLNPTQQGSQQQQHTSRLRAPQQGRSSSVTAPMQGGPNGFPVASAGDGYPNGGSVGKEALGESPRADASRDETIDRLNRVIRAKNATIKEQAKEVLRYKSFLDTVDDTVEEFDKDSRFTDQRVHQLADDLAVETRNHEAARRSLEEKTLEAEAARRSLEEQHSLKVAEVERASAAAHEENLELTRRLQEMNRLADEQQAAAEASVAAASAGAAAAEAGDGPAESPAAEGGGERLEELEKLQRAVKMKTRQLEAVTERATRTSRELQHFKGQARSGRFWSLLLRLWWLLRTVGFLGFLLFVYVAVSEDAFRSRGVDVYRLAH